VGLCGPGLARELLRCGTVDLERNAASQEALTQVNADQPDRAGLAKTRVGGRSRGSRRSSAIRGSPALGRDSPRPWRSGRVPGAVLARRVCHARFT
jgi:hypothetical protein